MDIVYKGGINMQISNAEWQVMRVIWSQGESTSQEITQLLAEKLDWTASTVKTLLTRLVSKEYIVANKEERRFVYSPLVTEDESVQEICQDVSEKICTKKIPKVIHELIQTHELTEEDIQALINQLKEKERVGQITCECIPGEHTC